eukprot:scaffold4745_cov67-Phaeocystis_antarctica.AAC.1
MHVCSQAPAAPARCTQTAAASGESGKPHGRCTSRTRPAPQQLTLAALANNLLRKRLPTVLASGV